MSFCVDVISEDSFYENLVLGVTKSLVNNYSESNQRVANVIVERRLPVDRVALSSWEQRHSIKVEFSIFKLVLEEISEDEESLPVGKININSLSDLTLLQNSKELLDNLPNNQINATDKSSQIGIKSKIFELDEYKGSGKVCLIHSENAWSIWLLDIEGGWTWLADTFVYYFRMALVHQGLPGWQAMFSKIGLAPWAEQLVLLMAPHLLMEKGEKNSRLVGSTNNDAPLNHIDPSIFKVPVKHSTRVTNTK
ncbi:tubulin polyglutamylase complex subunit 2 [Arctopsyche grandis]|uniref:tubulin polyglutamylase complex subunit 2 n=1 Tax=Arctopsyche grandis TaxID=121162 RepID=UPI00406D8297